MQEYDLSMDADSVSKLNQAFNLIGANKNTFPNTAQAIDEAAEYVQNVWADYLSEKNIPPKGMLHKENVSDFHARVVSDSKRVDAIQEGTSAVEYDMKKTHPYGRKSRVSKNGIPYLIIPFRWQTPTKGGEKGHSFFSSVIPTKIYETKLKAMKLSSTTGLTHPEANYKGQAIDRAEYNWGGRLKDMDDDRMNGMVRMKDVRGSTYFTFRIVSAKSPADKWWYRKKAVPGVDMIGEIEKRSKASVEAIIENGLMADILSK